MKTLWATIAAMFLFAGLAFGLPAFLPENHPAGVPAELLNRLKSTAMTGSKPALWVDVKSAHIAEDTPAGVAGTVNLRTLFGFNWAEITVFDDGTTGYHYHESRQWTAIIVFVVIELALGAVVIWNVFH